jgi:hypothetical protein
MLYGTDATGQPSYLLSLLRRERIKVRVGWLRTLTPTLSHKVGEGDPW